MLGLSMDAPLLLSRLLDYAGGHHGSTEIVGRRLDGVVERDTWSGLRWRARRLSAALGSLGIGLDGCVGSLAWNTIDHIELFYGALGIGAALHTLNPRITTSDLRYMVDQVGETVIFIDAGTLSVAEALAPLVPAVTTWVYMDEDGQAPPTTLPGLRLKSELVARFDPLHEWPSFDERQAATICFTSGTTGRPKGVVYSHRALTLGAMSMSMADMYGGYRPGSLECVMPIAAIFHANGWLMPFTAPMNGHKLVLPGRAFDPASVVALLHDEQVTVAGAVPTVWQDILDRLASEDRDLPALRVALVAGSRPSDTLVRGLEAMGVQLCQSWGMTEVPGAARATPPPGSDRLDAGERHDILETRQGRAAFLPELCLRDEGGQEVAMDGKAAGHLHVRGPTVAARYLGDPPTAAVEWLDTGDVARIHSDGTIEIVDRSKDVIKSGGEWISSLQIELSAMNHPAIARAAVIAVPHPRWQERPVLICTLRDQQQVGPDALRDHIAKDVARWWLPDAILFVDDMPLTATGKINKVDVRRLYGAEASRHAAGR